MCGKGGGSPPVPSSASTTFNSTVTPNEPAGSLYKSFLDRADRLSQTQFDPRMEGRVAPLNELQTTAANTVYNLGLNAQNVGNQVYGVGMNAGNWDPAQVQAIMSPFTQNVVGATQSWFNNQNAIQSNDLLSQAIRSGNAFGGDRAGVAQGVLAGQQQLAQAPVIANLYQQGYGQALDEFNKLQQLKLSGAQLGLAGQQFGLQGAGAALGAGSLYQQQQQREFDVAQQNAMMANAYPFQTLNWLGSILGGIGPLLGTTASGSNNPPEQSGLSTGLGAAAAGIGVLGGGGWRGGNVRNFARGGGLGGYAEGGSIYGNDDRSDDEDRASDSKAESYTREPDSRSIRLPETTATRPQSWGSTIGQLKTPARQLPQPILPQSGSTQPQKSPLQQGLETGTSLIKLASAAAPLFALSDPKTKTDVQRIGRTDDGQPLYGFRYKGDPKSYPKVVGPMARPMAWGGYIPRFQDGGDVDISVDDPLTMTDLGVLSPGGNELPRSIAGPNRGSPGGLPIQADDMTTLSRVRERFRPVLESNPDVARRFDINTTAEVGTNPARRDFYQALTLDRAAARGESLPYTLSRGPGTPDQYYPGTTANARAASGQGVSPALWRGYNPAGYATGNASGRVGFAGGPQTGSAGGERGGIEGPDLAAARRFGYTGPSRTAIGFGPGAPTGMSDARSAYAMDTSGTGEAAKASYVDRDKTGQGGDTRVDTGPSAATSRSSAERTGSTQPGLRERDIPSLAKPPPTFAQRLAQNPFWQFGTALMAKPGIKGRELSAIGSAAQVMSAQQLAERKRVLDEKPQMIKGDDGSIGFLTSEGKYTELFGASPSEQREVEKHRREMALPKEFTTEKPGAYGTTETRKESRVFDDRTGQWVTQQPQQTPQPATPQLERPSEPPAQAPQAPQAPQRPAPNAPAAPSVQQPQAPVRQTQYTPVEANDWQEIGANSGTFYSASTQQYKTADGRIIPALDKGVRQGLPPSQGQAVAGGPVVGGPEAPSAAGPAEGPSLNGTARSWTSGEVQPAGTVTQPDVLAARRNEAALQGLSPQEIANIKNLVDYKVDPNKLFIGRDAKLRGPAIAKAQQYDPAYNPTLYAQHVRANNAFANNGVEARNIQSHDTAIQHMGRAMTNVERLNNYDAEWINRARDWVQKKGVMRDPQLQQAIGALDFDYHAVASELMRAFRGTGSASEREAHRIAEKLNVYAPLDVQRETIREATELLYGRIESSAKTYNGAVDQAFQRPPEAWLSGKSRETLDRALNIDPNKPIPPAGGAAPQQQQGPSGGLSAQDQQAIDWARRNPDNPKAKQILQLHGMQ